MTLSESPNLSTDSPRRASRSGDIARDQLRSILTRIEQLEEEKAGIAADIKDIFAEAKGNGYDVKTLRKVIALRKQDAAEREEAAHLLDTYCIALGMKVQMSIFDEADMASPEQNADLYHQAKEIVLRDRKPSTSYLQRMLRIGYSRAAQLIEVMEAEGVVSAANHIGKRDVLV